MNITKKNSIIMWLNQTNFSIEVWGSDVAEGMMIRYGSQSVGRSSRDETAEQWLPQQRVSWKPWCLWCLLHNIHRLLSEPASCCFCCSIWNQTAAAISMSATSSPPSPSSAFSQLPSSLSFPYEYLCLEVARLDIWSLCIM